MAGNLPAVRAVQWTVSGLWKTVEILTGHMKPKYIATDAKSTAYETSANLLFRLSNHKNCDAISYTGIVLEPPDCVAV